MIAKLLPFVSQLGGYLKAAIDHYAMLKAAGKDASVGVITLFVAGQLESWDPKIGAKALLDFETRNAAARFIAGVAVNLAGV